MTPCEAIAAAVEYEPNTGCWLWARAADRDGYGHAHMKGLSRRAHRASWQAHRGPIPHGLNVLHRCDTPACVNPEHLRLGTQAQNTAEAAAKGRIHRSTVDRCLRGHEFTQENTYRRPQGDRECRACRRLKGALRKVPVHAPDASSSPGLNK